MRPHLWGAAMLGLAACSDGNTHSTPDDDDAPPVPANAGAFESAFVSGGATLDCGMAAEAMLSSDAARVTFGDTTLLGGYVQQSSNNQNPVVARVEGGSVVFCEVLENDGPDGRVLGLTWDGSATAYGVGSIDGGGSDLEGQDGWLSAYAPGAINGGGPKVSYVFRLDAESGAVDTVSFIIAVLSDNKVNTHAATAAPTVRDDGSVEFRGDSRFRPIDTNGSSPMTCQSDPFITRYRLSADLGSLICADSTGCTSSQPCDG